jgi:hypothetical protein
MTTTTSPRRPDWRDQAACTRHEPEDWFPHPTNLAAIDAAKQVCFRCPVMLDCAQYALTTRQETGVWGGLSEGQRYTLTKKRRVHTAGPDAIRAEVLRVLRPEMDPVTRLEDVWERSTRPLPGGHLAWAAGTAAHVTIRGVTYTANQLAFTVDRGRRPVGMVRRTPDCEVVECIHPRHLEDAEERELRRKLDELGVQPRPVEAVAS